MESESDSAPAKMRSVAIAMAVIVAAGIFWLVVGAASLAISRARNTQPQPGNASATVPTGEANQGAGTATLTATAPVTVSSPPSAIPSATPSATPTTVPATPTRRPPTATPTATPFADLSCMQMTHIGQTVNDDHTFAAIIRNQGTMAVPAGYVIEWEVNGTSTSYFQLDSGPAVGPGQQVAVEHTFDIHPPPTPGPYMTVLSVDFQNDVSESSESNNTCSISYSLFDIAPTIIIIATLAQ